MSYCIVNKAAEKPSSALTKSAKNVAALIDDLLRGSAHYHYEALDRLTQVEGPNPKTFVHDPAGNILSSNTESHASSPTHNSRNSTLTARGKQQAIKQHLHYNALNQLTSVDVQSRTTRYQYDALGRRISKRSAVNTTEFLWLDNTLLSETTTDIGEQPQTAKIYLFEPGTHKPLAIVQNDDIYHYHLDHLGTPQEITNAQGEIAWSASYKAYGNLALVQDNEIENNIRFQGQYYDEETGLHYNRFRYYDPECGRFISQDPIGLLGGVNNYQYAPNPVSWVDPFGLTCKENPWNTLVPDSIRYLDSTTPSGSTVHHGKHSTAIGSDDVTLGNFQQATNTGNGHNVIVHGSRPDYDAQGGVFIVDGNPTNSQQIVDGLVSNPNYQAGSPVCLVSCWSGSNGTAQEVANALNATVTAPTRPVRFNKSAGQLEQMSDAMMMRSHPDLIDIKPEMKEFDPENY